MAVDSAFRTDTSPEIYWEDFIWALGTACGERRVSFDGVLFMRHFTPPYTFAQLATALQAHGVHALETTTDALRRGDGGSYIVLRRPDDGAAPAPRRVSLVARSDGGLAQALNLHSLRPYAVPVGLLEEIFATAAISIDADRETRAGG